MRRKVIKQGPATMMVSLPSKWVKENRIAAGDEVGVLPQGDKLIISKGQEAAKRKEITLDITDYKTYMELSRYLTVLYKTGYNKIELNYRKQAERMLVTKRKEELNIKSAIRVIVNRFIGAEIVSQSSNKTEIECLATEENPNLDKIADRIYFLFKETIGELFDSIGKNYIRFHDEVVGHHDNITKFINYYFRTLYNSDKSEEEKKFAFAFYTVLELLVDKTKYISDKLHENGCTPKVKEYLKDIFGLFFEQYDFIKNNQVVTEDFIIRRYDFRGKLKSDKFSTKEYPIIMESLPFLEAINVFIEYSVVKDIVKKN